MHSHRAVERPARTGIVMLPAEILDPAAAMVEERGRPGAATPSVAPEQRWLFRSHD